MVRIKTALVCVLAVATLLSLSACGGDEGAAEENGGDTSETVSESASEDDGRQQKKGYTYNIGTGWREAYSEEGYEFYYMNISEAEYDSNVVMSVTDDESLGGADIDSLKERLREQYGESAKLEVEKIGKYDTLYIETKEKTEMSTAYLGQYVVLGEERAVIFSVYAKEASFPVAKEKTKNVVGTVKF